MRPRGWDCPARLGAPSQSGGSASRPASSELLKPSAKAGLCTTVTFSSPSVSATRGASKPVTTTTGSAPLAMATPATRATIGLPATGSINLLRGAMREDRPAASTMAAIFAPISARPCRVVPR
jgi:hypothetical protein